MKSSNLKKKAHAIKTKAKDYANSLKSKQLATAKQTLINIENSTFFGILLKGLVNNWFSVILIGVISGYAINLYLQNKAYENEALKVEISRLNSIVSSNEQINSALQIKIKELQNQKNNNIKENSKYHDALSKLNSDQLYQKILSHISRLKKRRGLK